MLKDVPLNVLANEGNCKYAPGISAENTCFAKPVAAFIFV